MGKEEMIAVVSSIPYGKVASYGRVAVQMEKRYALHSSGWLVGRMLNTLPEGTQIPRRRVINRQGVISALKLGEKGLRQVALLESEGVIVIQGKVNMAKYDIGLR